MKGKNIAEYTTAQKLIYENSQNKGYCVFLSHKKEDKKAAIAIGQVIDDVMVITGESREEVYRGWSNTDKN